MNPLPARPEADSQIRFQAPFSYCKSTRRRSTEHLVSQQCLLQPRVLGTARFSVAYIHGRPLPLQLGRSRRRAAQNAVAWDGRTIGQWSRCIDGALALVNLTGKNVNCRYTRTNLQEINASRVDSVNVIAKAIAACSRPPRTLVQASTLAICGDAGDLICDETAPPGSGIPVQTVTMRERAFSDNPTPGTRRVILRISFALDRGGGDLATLTGLTRCFLGGRAGRGRQFISWIHTERDVPAGHRTRGHGGDLQRHVTESGDQRSIHETVAARPASTLGAADACVARAHRMLPDAHRAGPGIDREARCTTPVHGAGFQLQVSRTR